MKFPGKDGSKNAPRPPWHNAAVSPPAVLAPEGRPSLPLPCGFPARPTLRQGCGVTADPRQGLGLARVCARSLAQVLLQGDGQQKYTPC